MNIGSLAERTGVSPKTIRYYESVSLLPRAERQSNGYRTYSSSDVATVNFIHRARNLGFSIKQVAALLELWQDKNRASADVKALALAHIGEIEERIGELEALRLTLVDLTEHCHGDQRPDCPILDGLAGTEEGGHPTRS